MSNNTTPLPLTRRDAEPSCRWPRDAVRLGRMTEAEARSRIEYVLRRCGPITAMRLRSIYLIPSTL